MKKAFYSEVLNKYSEDEKKLMEEEKAFLDRKAEIEQKKAERANRAKEVEDAYKHYNELLDGFIKDYGSFHLSYSKTSDAFNNFNDFFKFW